MNLHHLENPTDEKIKELIGRRFDTPNIFKNTPGNFYTVNRKEDTVLLCYEVLEERKRKQHEPRNA